MKTKKHGGARKGAGRPVTKEPTVVKKPHGGKRVGSGRKAKEPTIVIRVPVSRLEDIKNMLDEKR